MVMDSMKRISNLKICIHHIPSQIVSQPKITFYHGKYGFKNHEKKTGEVDGMHFRYGLGALFSTFRVFYVQWKTKTIYT